MTKFEEALKSVNEACQTILGEKAYNDALKAVKTTTNLHGPSRGEVLAAVMLARTQPRS